MNFVSLNFFSCLKSFVSSRKRWFNKTSNHSPADEDQSGLNQPMAKKSKSMFYSVKDQLTNNSTSNEVAGIKRSNMASSSSETLPKKPALETKRNRYAEYNKYSKYIFALTAQNQKLLLCSL